MNKRQPGELVLRGSLSAIEAEARAINAQPWQPLPGMAKRQGAAWLETSQFLSRRVGRAAGR